MRTSGTSSRRARAKAQAAPVTLGSRGPNGARRTSQPRAGQPGHQKSGACRLRVGEEASGLRGSRVVHAERKALPGDCPEHPPPPKQPRTTSRHPGRPGSANVGRGCCCPCGNAPSRPRSIPSARWPIPGTLSRDIGRSAERQRAQTRQAWTCADQGVVPLAAPRWDQDWTGW